jgi:leucyl-tRNA synthetase
MQKYDPKQLEPKWQKLWAKTKLYEVTEESRQQPYYVLDMFPYPSGSGLHIGHVRNFSISDSYARYTRRTGKNVLHPMGWDAFGLPAENYAIMTGIAPQKATKDNTDNFRRQLQALGFSYDWSREIDSSKPDFYRWTQWFFLLLYQRGLAYQAESLQWWCDKCKTVLANEQVVNGCCWRHENTLVTKRLTKQWFFKITEYADRLLEDLEDLDWPEKIKAMQRNWIGRSVGAELEFTVVGSKKKIKVFTTRPDTLYGATYMVLAPEHPLVEAITTEKQRQAVTAYVAAAEQKSDIERMNTEREKTGVFTGAYAINPATDQQIPVWAADYVLGGYGTGAIMAVPAHDQRDYEFARKFELPVQPVVEPSLIDAINPPRTDAKNTTRTIALCVVRNPKTGLYLTLKWKKFPWHTFVTGGIEEGEERVAAAKREIIEETGYKNLKFVAEMPFTLNSIFYAAHKQVNRNITVHVMQFELADEELGHHQREDHEDFEVVWVPQAELSKLEPVTGLDLIVRWLEEGDYAYVGEGRLVNSGVYDGLGSAEAREKMVSEFGKEKVNYRMRDWLISRQRYWGAPIPMIHCEKCGTVPVPEADLPVVLPHIDSYEPTGDGKAPLGRATDWVKVSCPQCDGLAERETDTMDGFACSSWYFLRFADPHNNKEAFAAKKAEYWLPVDTYVGGAEHAVMHLLYARFWTKVMQDAGLVSFSEPFRRLRNQGMILGPDGSKMSKSLGNVIDPLDLVNEGYGADALRLYELFIGPYDQAVAWNPNGIDGTKRFLNRVWALVQDHLAVKPVAGQAETGTGEALETAVAVTIHKTIRKATVDIESFSFNTAIAAMMEAVNELYKLKTKLPLGSTAWQPNLKLLVQILAPFAPHIAEELWQQLDGEGSVHIASWPAFNPQLVTDEVITIVIQVNGKLRAQIEVAADTPEAEIKAAAHEQIVRHTEDKQIAKTIYVPGKLVNFVVR